MTGVITVLNSPGNAINVIVEVSEVAVYLGRDQGIASITASNAVILISADTQALSVPGINYIYILSNGATLTLPTAIGNRSRYSAKNADGSACSVDTLLSQTVDGSLVITMDVQNQSLDFISDDTNWGIF